MKTSESKIETPNRLYAIISRSSIDNDGESHCPNETVEIIKLGPNKSFLAFLTHDDRSPGNVRLYSELVVPELDLHAVGKFLTVTDTTVFATELVLDYWERVTVSSLSTSSEPTLSPQTPDQTEVFTRTIHGRELTLYVSGIEDQQYIRDSEDQGVPDTVMYSGDLRIVCEGFSSLNIEVIHLK